MRSGQHISCQINEPLNWLCREQASRMTDLGGNCSRHVTNKNLTRNILIPKIMRIASMVAEPNRLWRREIATAPNIPAGTSEEFCYQNQAVPVMVAGHTNGVSGNRSNPIFNRQGALDERSTRNFTV
jgi:hypothetical protein